jgi:hypothetical protein
MLTQFFFNSIKYQMLNVKFILTVGVLAKSFLFLRLELFLELILSPESMGLHF